MGEFITLSEQHGVNPSVGVCFWCGEEDGTVALVGRMTGDAQAPHRAVWSYDPCPTCKKGMESGISLIECSEWIPEDGRVPITPEGHHPALYPTGRLLVITEDAARRAFTDDVIEGILRHRACFIDPEAFAGLMPESLRDE